VLVSVDQGCMVPLAHLAKVDVGAVATTTAVNCSLLGLSTSLEPSVPFFHMA
jgi:hypothetical protein